MSGALVVGGGPAGAAVAIGLARQGHSVRLVEREATPRDKVCGEFLSGEALGYLSGLGVDVRALGAVPIDQVRMVRGRAMAAQPLPFPAMSLSRRLLDEALLGQASAAGVELRRGQRVDGIGRRGSGFTARLGDGSELTTQSLFLCSGKHDVRGLRRPPGRQSELVGFKLHFRLTPAQQAELGSSVELFLFCGGYGGLEPIEDGLANLCLLVQQQRLQALGGWEALLASIRRECPHLDQRLGGAAARWEKPLALSAIPYGYVCAAADGIWRLGDQAAVIPSFSGDGISIALHSARVAAAVFAEHGSASDFQRRLRHELRRQVTLATTISQALVAVPAPLMAVVRLLPQLLRHVASLTRIRQDGIICLRSRERQGLHP
jgi:flavin-dependent dehydrogenase